MTDQGAVALRRTAEPFLPRRVTEIRPARGRFSLDLGELWAYRELLFFLVWRDVKVRYKQTALGALWAVIQPVVSMIIFSIIFGRFANIPSDGLPYPIFVYAGLLAWLYFAQSLSLSSISVVGSSALVSKVYFPRLIIPLASVATPVIDFLVAFSVLVGLMLWYGVVPGLAAFATVGFLLLAFLVAFGVGLWFSALNVRYRDVPYALPFVVQVWMFATPVIYPASLVPEKWQWILSLNPMTGVIEGFRWALLGEGSPTLVVLGTSALVGVLTTIGGLWYFNRTEQHFADII